MSDIDTQNNLRYAPFRVREELFPEYRERKEILIMRKYVEALIRRERILAGLEKETHPVYRMIRDVANR